MKGMKMETRGQAGLGQHMTTTSILLLSHLQGNPREFLLYVGISRKRFLVVE